MWMAVWLFVFAYTDFHGTRMYDEMISQGFAGACIRISRLFSEKMSANFNENALNRLSFNLHIAQFMRVLLESVRETDENYANVVLKLTHTIGKTRVLLQPTYI